MNGVELLGGPADGRLLEWSGPLPVVIVVPLEPVRGLTDPRDDYGYAPAELRRAEYRRVGWNPITGRQQYVHG